MKLKQCMRNIWHRSSHLIDVNTIAGVSGVLNDMTMYATIIMRVGAAV